MSAPQPPQNNHTPNEKIVVVQRGPNSFQSCMNFIGAIGLGVFMIWFYVALRNQSEGVKQPEPQMSYQNAAETASTAEVDESSISIEQLETDVKEACREQNADAIVYFYDEATSAGANTDTVKEVVSLGWLAWAEARKSPAFLEVEQNHGDSKWVKTLFHYSGHKYTAYLNAQKWPQLKPEARAPKLRELSALCQQDDKRNDPSPGEILISYRLQGTTQTLATFTPSKGVTML